ncbi:uncharacterized protein LOC141981851 [Natator depressus]|uniref:uncharacterized protein LOC141981851 n=1 Tax=Natator depressus TaxID=27790 RepID=UPI003EBCA4A8
MPPVKPPSLQTNSVPLFYAGRLLIFAGTPAAAGTVSDSHPEIIWVITEYYGLNQLRAWNNQGDPSARRGRRRPELRLLSQGELPPPAFPAVPLHSVLLVTDKRCHVLLCGSCSPRGGAGRCVQAGRGGGGVSAGPVAHAQKCARRRVAGFCNVSACRSSVTVSLLDVARGRRWGGVRDAAPARSGGAMGSVGRWRLFFCCVGPPQDNESVLRCCSNKVHPEWAGESKKEGEESNQEITWPEGPAAHYEKADRQVKEEVEIQVSVALLSLQEAEDPKFPVHTKDHVQTPNLEILTVEKDPLSSLKTEAHVQSSNPDILCGEEEEEEEEKKELVEEGELEFLSLLHFEIQEPSSHLETSVEEPLTFLKTEALVQSSDLEILGEQKLPSLLDTETEVHVSDLDIRDAEKTSLSIDTGLNVPTKNRSRNLSGLVSLLDIPGAREEPLTQKQIAAFKDVFKVISSTEGSIKMRGLKLILHSVGINVTHQEICEALNRADIDGDGQVNFTDFVTVLTDDQRFAQSMGKNCTVKERKKFDPSSFFLLAKLSLIMGEELRLWIRETDIDIKGNLQSNIKNILNTKKSVI